jgi:hypothetical protein
VFITKSHACEHFSMQKARTERNWRRQLTNTSRVKKMAGEEMLFRQHATVQFPFKGEIPASDTLSRLQSAYGDACVCASRVKMWVGHWKKEHRHRLSSQKWSPANCLYGQKQKRSRLAHQRESTVDSEGNGIRDCSRTLKSSIWWKSLG